MKVAGIIAEYNPFHNGHAYQLEQVKKTHDAVVCVMSGSFVQRGDVAIFDKWTRAEAALSNGADLVLELPTAYASATAERFSDGAVRLLDALGIVDGLFFGSECGDIEKITKAASVLANEPPEISEKIKTLLKGGLSYPVAREQAFSGLIDADLLHEPNNLLGLEYCRALEKHKSNIRPHTIRRAGCSHHEQNPQSTFASASALRSMLYAGTDISQWIPKNLHASYQTATVHRLQYLESAIFTRLRTATCEELQKLPDVTEGLENRFLRAARQCTTLVELIGEVSAKRYPVTRLQRILVSVLTGLEKSDCLLPISYIRVLGFTETGRELLRQIKEHTTLPIITKTADFKESDRLFSLDLRASDLFALCTHPFEPAGADFTKNPVFLRK